MGSSGGSCEHFLGQLSSSDGGSAPHQLLQREWDCGTGTGSRRGSRRWSRKKGRARGHRRGGGFCRTEEAAAASRKRVVVVVDQSSGAKHAMMWALTHVANRGDFLTLLHVLPPHSGSGGGGRGAGEEDASALANSLGALCKACKPEVRVRVLTPSLVRSLFLLQRVPEHHSTPLSTVTHFFVSEPELKRQMFDIQTQISLCGSF
jgi:hypothetical protein